MIFVFMSMEGRFSVIEIQDAENYTNERTSSSTSSMKFAVMTNFSLHFLVTCDCALLHTHPSGYGL